MGGPHILWVVPSLGRQAGRPGLYRNSDWVWAGKQARKQLFLSLSALVSPSRFLPWLRSMMGWPDEINPLLTNGFCSVFDHSNREQTRTVSHYVAQAGLTRSAVFVPLSLLSTGTTCMPPKQLKMRSVRERKKIRAHRIELWETLKGRGAYRTVAGGAGGESESMYLNNHRKKPL